MAANQDLEEGLEFAPKFDKDGFIPAIAQDARTGQILMVAYMNHQSLNETVQSGYATYFSRSRGKLWKKGEESGQESHLTDEEVKKKMSAFYDFINTLDLDDFDKRKS